MKSKGLAKSLLTASLIAWASMLPGCESVPKEIKTTAKVVATPLAMARDVVDFGLVVPASIFDTDDVYEVEYYTQDRRGGEYGYFTFPPRAIANVLYIADRITCRSFYPNFPGGIGPKPNGKLYLFPNTKALWDKEDY